ncbi:hypothetical protein ACLH0O_03100 [Aeromonas media]|jgi:hypothetical protein|uniref:hypothetical protein n=1 Tax=Aeromonas rivipollensis TaxID=948519 RepID=UPI0038D17076
MSINDSISELQKYIPGLDDLIKRHTASSMSDFVEQLYIDLENAIQNTENNRHQVKGNFSEDYITTLLLAHLNALNYDATHDTQIGGHCDILIRNKIKGFQWIGEAKIWSGCKYIMGGWEQLCCRYSSGTYRDSHGGMLIYVNQKNASGLLSDWHGHMVKAGIDNLKITPNPNNPLRFDSTHNHVASGLSYNVRHFALVMYHP